MLLLDEVALEELDCVIVVALDDVALDPEEFVEFDILVAID